MTPNIIEFRSTADNTWVMRITADRRIEVNADVDVNEAAQKVLDAMQTLLTQQKRTWVGLTDDEVNCFVDVIDHWSLANVKAIEAKLKEKNT